MHLPHMCIIIHWTAHRPCVMVSLRNTQIPHRDLSTMVHIHNIQLHVCIVELASNILLITPSGNHRIVFLPLNCVPELRKKAKFKELFSTTYFSNRYI